MNMAKPAWQTSQFWYTLAATLVSFLVTLGFVSAANQAGLEGAISRAIEAVGGLIAAVAAIWRYTAFREQMYLAEADAREILLKKGE